MSLPPSSYSSTSGWKPLPSQTSHVVATPAIIARSLIRTPAPLQVGHAPSEFALNNAALTPLAFANALRIGSSRPV
jgi:hypothetical protein